VKKPKKPREWQECVNAAQVAISLDAAQRYGFIREDGTVDLARAMDLLAQGKALGYVPRTTAIEQFAHALARNFKGGSTQ
jgi:hypothetical protein